MHSQYSPPTSFLLQVDEYDLVRLKLTSDNTNLYDCTAASGITYSRTETVSFHQGVDAQAGQRVGDGKRWRGNDPSILSNSHPKVAGDISVAKFDRAAIDRRSMRPIN